MMDMKSNGIEDGEYRIIRHTIKNGGCEMTKMTKNLSVQKNGKTLCHNCRDHKQVPDGFVKNLEKHGFGMCDCHNEICEEDGTVITKCECKSRDHFRQ